MKVKLSWFVFIPVFILLIAIKALELAGFTQLFEFLSAPYLSVGVVIAGFAISYLLAFLDKKTSVAYLIQRNIPACLFSLISATAIASKSFLSIFQSLLYAEYSPLVFITSFVGIFASVSLVAISLGHFQGKNFLPHIGMVFLSIPVWFCLLLIDCFLEGRVVSAVDIDPIRIFVCVFGMMLFLNLPMVIAVIEGKNPVKSTIIYGLAFAPLGVLYGFNTVYSVITDKFDYSENIIGVAFFALAIYALTFLYEITKNVGNNDEIEYSFDFDNYDSIDDFYGITKDEVVIAEDDNEIAPENYDFELTDKEFDDFITEKSEDVIHEDYDEPYIDDIVVASDNDEVDDDGVIFVRKNTAKAFEDQVLETNSPAIPRVSKTNDTIVNDFIISKSPVDVERITNLQPDVSLDKIKNNFINEDSFLERESLEKIDRLLLDLGSIDDI